MVSKRKQIGYVIFYFTTQEVQRGLANCSLIIIKEATSTQIPDLRPCDVQLQMHQVSVAAFVEFAVNSDGSQEGVLGVKRPAEEKN